MTTLPSLDTATAPAGLPVATEIRWYAAKIRRDGNGYRKTTAGMERWADTIEADAAQAQAEIDRLSAEIGWLRSALARLQAGSEWMTYDPIDSGYDPHYTEADARDVFAALVDDARDRGGDGWSEEAEQIALYRLVPVATTKLRHTSTSTDDTDDGAKCRAAGWDFLAVLDVVEWSP